MKSVPAGYNGAEQAATADDLDQTAARRRRKTKTNIAKVLSEPIKRGATGRSPHEQCPRIERTLNVWRAAGGRFDPRRFRRRGGIFGGLMNWSFIMAGSASTKAMLFAVATWLVLEWRNAGWVEEQRNNRAQKREMCAD